jgi:hypothetical protein
LDRVVRFRNGRQRRAEGRVLLPSIDIHGYRTVCLKGNGKAKTQKIATLVALTFLGPRPEAHVVRHGVGGQLDDSLANLCWGTKSEDIADKVRDGTFLYGDRCSWAKLTRDQVVLARQLVAAGPRGTSSRLAREWGVSPATLNDAVLGKRWAWLEDQPA